ncbi:MFS transporter [Mycolicibacterium chubuense]|uniref:Major Facilitator Superfamily protein n=1 Tax=Mycolicibacterium chubuense TaxID=1800 RepID=A0A0J6VMM6_MYCCU|nr:Major Facilitator Superfamily protein [Mycolicibacterium chubuense]ORA52955.1 MFS transporter [Mycolicibacterium chubuense]SPX98053.1 Major facilitator superfamily MFS_1 [Mycolicibacterium chubuense]
MRRHLHTGVRAVLPTSAALAAAMGVGRFVYTPILPLMTAQAGLTAQVAGHLATANYVGYLAGAVATTMSPRLARSAVACRVALVGIVVSLAAMAVTVNVFAWLTLRTAAGFASAVVFVVAVNTLLERLPEKVGWGFGGVGAGIVVSAAAVLALPTESWRTAWWVAAGLAAMLGAAGWWVRPQRVPATAATARAQVHHAGTARFALLFAGYTLEGIGYIIAGTFLVAAVAQHSPGSLGTSVWLVVGVAVIPSAGLWARLGGRMGRPAVLTAALALQAAGIALACQGSSVASLLGALLFGGTFIGVSTLAMAEGRLLGTRGAVALLTVGYSVGQIVGPLLVAPLLGGGYRPALGVSALIVSLAALAIAAVWILGRQPRARLIQAQRRTVPGEFVDDRPHGRSVLAGPPHE